MLNCSSECLYAASLVKAYCIGPECSACVVVNAKFQLAVGVFVPEIKAEILEGIGKKKIAAADFDSFVLFTVRRITNIERADNTVVIISQGMPAIISVPK